MSTLEIIKKLKELGFRWRNTAKKIVKMTGTSDDMVELNVVRQREKNIYIIHGELIKTTYPHHRDSVEYYTKDSKAICEYCNKNLNFYSRKYL